MDNRSTIFFMVGFKPLQERVLKIVGKTNLILLPGIVQENKIIIMHPFRLTIQNEIFPHTRHNVLPNFLNLV